MWLNLAHLLAAATTKQGLRFFIRYRYGCLKLNLVQIIAPIAIATTTKYKETKKFLGGKNLVLIYAHVNFRIALC